MHSVTILPDEVELPVNDGETILDAVLRDGFTYRFGCRRGGCTQCKLALVAGEVRYGKRIAPEVLSDEERMRGVCLSCRAIPESDVVIRLQEDDHLKCVSPLSFRIAQQRLAGRSASEF